MPRIAVDLLGGDAAPDVVVAGVRAALADLPDLEVLLVGPPEFAQPLLDEDRARGRVRLLPAVEHVGMGEHPARAVRAKRNASVVVAMRSLRQGDADAVVSAGSTGATMAAAVTVLGRLPGISRPALAALLPAVRGPVILLDVGANAGASAELLLQFALAGAAYARVHLGIEEPTVGLLNVGTETGKGDVVRRTVEPRLEQALRGEAAVYRGNVEADAVALGGVVDVVVTDGFTGNVLLKGIEGAIVAVGEALGEVQRREALDRLAPLQAETQGGAVLLGVDGVVVVGHGASTAPAIAACVRGAADAVSGRLLPRVRDALGRMSRGGEG